MGSYAWRVLICMACAHMHSVCSYARRVLICKACAHMHGVCSYDHKAIAEGLNALKLCFSRFNFWHLYPI